MDEVVEELQKTHKIVGRKDEITLSLLAAKAGKHILLEGAVGVGKTTIALAVASHLERSFIRIDGDERYTEQKLSGWFLTNQFQDADKEVDCSDDNALGLKSIQANEIGHIIQTPFPETKYLDQDHRDQRQGKG